MGKRYFAWAYWQFKNGSLAELHSGNRGVPSNTDQLPPRFYVAWDRSLGCEVAYAAN